MIGLPDLNRAIVRALLAGLVAGLALAALVVGLGAWLTDDTPVAAHLPAAPAPQVAGEIKTATPIATHTVRALPAKAKKALKLPDAIQEDPAKVVLDSSRVAADSHATTVTTLLDTETGESLTLARREPLPWLAPEGATRIWLGAGYRNGDPVLRGEVDKGLLSVKAWRISARAGVDVPLDADGEAGWFAGIGLGREWRP